MSEQPWWGIPLVAGVFAFVGVIVAQVVILLLDYFKVKRDDARRWHNDRRRIYAEMLVGVAKVMKYILDYQTDDEFNQGETDKMMTDIAFKVAEVEIVASESVRLAGDDIAYVLNEILDHLRDTHRAITNEQDDKLTQSVEAFTAAARKELGVIN